MDANASIDAWITALVLPLTLVAFLGLAGCLAAALVEAVQVRVTGADAWSWSPAPHVVRRWTFALCGLGLVIPAAPAISGVAAAADMSTAASARGATDLHEEAHDPHQTCPPRCAGLLDGLRLPDLPAREPRQHVVVRPGDCLWTIAESQLSSDESDVHVARRVRQLYRINHQRIGPDPDLIFPGTHLTAPEAPR
jgi:hypothetical protein